MAEPDVPDQQPALQGSSLDTRIVKSSGWLAAGIGGTQILSLVSIVVLARLLEPKAFGLIAIVLVFLAFLEPIQESGLGAALIYRRTQIEEAAATVLAYAPLLGLALAGSTCLVAPLAARWFDAPDLTNVLRAMSLTLVARGLCVVPTAILERELDFRARAKADVAAAVVQSVIAIALAVAGAGVWSLVVGYVAGAGVQAAMLWLLVPWRPSPRLANRAMLRELVRYGRFVGAAHVVNLLNRTLDNVTVGRVLGTTALGAYSVGYRIASAPANVIGQIVGKAMFPAYSMLQDDLAGARRAYVQNLQRVALLALPASIALALTAQPLVETLLGDRWLAAVPVLRILALYGFVKSLTATCGAVWLGRGKPQIDLTFQIAHLALLVPALILLTGRWGLVGAAGAMLLVDVLTGVPALAVTMRLLGLRLAEVGAALARPLLCSSVLAGALSLLLPVQAGLSPVAALALLGGAGGIVYVSSAAVFARGVVGPIWSSLRRAGT